MKPLFFADTTITPRGRSCSSAPSTSSSSISTPAESTLAEVPGLSKVSQAMPSASRSSFQDRALASFMAISHRYVQAAVTAESADCGGAPEVAAASPTVAPARTRKSHTSGR